MTNPRRISGIGVALDRVRRLRGRDRSTDACVEAAAREGSPRTGLANATDVRSTPRSAAVQRARHRTPFALFERPPEGDTGCAAPLEHRGSND